MENWREGALQFDATMTLDRVPLGSGALAGALLRYPLLPFKVAAAIYWQALRCGSSACRSMPSRPDRRRTPRSRRTHREARPMKPSIVPTVRRPGAAGPRQLAATPRPGGCSSSASRDCREGELTVIDGEGRHTFGRRTPSATCARPSEVLHPQTYADVRSAARSAGGEAYLRGLWRADDLHRADPPDAGEPRRDAVDGGRAALLTAPLRRGLHWLNRKQPGRQPAQTSAAHYDPQRPVRAVLDGPCFVRRVRADEATPPSIDCITSRFNQHQADQRGEVVPHATGRAGRLRPPPTVPRRSVGVGCGGSTSMVARRLHSGVRRPKVCPALAVDHGELAFAQSREALEEQPPAEAFAASCRGPGCAGRPTVGRCWVSLASLSMRPARPGVRACLVGMGMERHAG